MNTSPLSSQYTEAISSSEYRSKGENSSYQSRRLSDVNYDIPSTYQSRRASQSSQGGRARENIKLVPIKYKDLIQVLEANPQYKDKSPLMIKMKESEIDKIIEKQQYHNSDMNSTRPHRSLRQSIQLSPTTLNQSVKRSRSSKRHSFEPDYTSPDEQTSRSDNHQFNRELKPPFGENQAQIYAMTGIEAYPMIGAGKSAFKTNKGRKRTPRKRSQQKIAREIKRNRIGIRSSSGRPESRSRSRGFRAKSRARSRRRKSPRPKKIVRLRSRRTPRARSTVIVKRKRRPIRRVSMVNNRVYCTPYPMCDYNCTPLNDPGTLQCQYRRSSRPLISQNKARMTCNCTLCQEKLQFIQPGVCSQKKDMWTNEYAIIPKPQVNLIDPCKELDPLIYPRADRPCIRDGRGNPLTDCIGRPLRDPVGKRFLNFNGNGSVMDTNFRGNFFTGQPPLCVKCPMPGTSCAPDTTHNWWMSCGYPVQANMSPFFNNVVAAENARRRC